MVVRTVCSPVALRVHAWAATGHMGEPVLCSHLRVCKRIGPTCAYSMIYNYIILCLCAYCYPSVDHFKLAMRNDRPLITQIYKLLLLLFCKSDPIGIRKRT